LIAHVTTSLEALLPKEQES